MDSIQESELDTMLKLTKEKLELCLKINCNSTKRERLLNEYLTLFKLINSEKN